MSGGKTVDEVIAERQTTHGDFRKVSSMSQALCTVMTSGVNWDDRLPDHFREGLEMIQHKVARILSGDWRFTEHWLDIAGYATRVRTIIEEDGAKQSMDNSQTQQMMWHPGHAQEVSNYPDPIDDINRRLVALETAKPAVVKGKKLDDIERRLAELELGEVEEARRLLDVESRLELIEKWRKSGG